MISFKTLVRIAALAAGVALGSQAGAASFNYTDSNCSGFSVTDNGAGSFTLNCLQLACTATASPTTQIPGNQISVTASCSGVGGVSYVWTPVAGNDANCPANVSPSTGTQTPLGGFLTPVGAPVVANCSYKLVGTDGSNQTGTKTITVNWAAGAPPAPTGCSVSASPTSVGANRRKHRRDGQVHGRNEGDQLDDQPQRRAMATAVGRPGYAQ